MNENGSDVVRWFGDGDDPGGRVVNDLKPVKQFGGKTEHGCELSTWFQVSLNNLCESLLQRCQINNLIWFVSSF